MPRGLPGPLPAGERLLWQGAPGWREAALGIVHLRKLCGYFMLLAFLCTLRALAGGSDHPWLSLVALLVCAALSLSLLALFALLVSRTSVYTITDRRVVLRIGVAWGMSINLPFAMIESANLRLKRDGSGDIALLLSGPNRMGIVTLWPHVRPWHARRVQPMLRALPNARQVAALLSQALADSLARDAEAALSTDAGILAEDTGVPAAGDGHPIVPADPSYRQPARPADLLGTPLGLVLTSVGTGKAS